MQRKVIKNEEKRSSSSSFIKKALISIYSATWLVGGFGMTAAMAATKDVGQEPSISQSETTEINPAEASMLSEKQKTVLYHSMLIAFYIYGGILLATGLTNKSVKTAQLHSVTDYDINKPLS